MKYFSESVFINDYLNPSNVNLLDSLQDDFTEVKLPEVLKGLDISEEAYENALNFFDENGLQLYLRCPTNSCFVNNYFGIGLLVSEVS